MVRSEANILQANAIGTLDHHGLLFHTLNTFRGRMQSWGSTHGAVEQVVTFLREEYTSFPGLVFYFLALYILVHVGIRSSTEHNQYPRFPPPWVAYIGGHQYTSHCRGQEA